MRVALLILIMSLGAYDLCAQYWFGPKVGGNRNSFVYQSDFYKDTFDIAPTYNFEVGGVLIYQATDMFSVQTELFYERVKKDLKSRENFRDTYEFDVVSTSTNHFLAIPVQFRMSFGKEPVHYYVSGGTKIRYWMAGKGVIEGEDDGLANPVKTYDKLVFNRERANPENNVYAVPDANRFQFALVAGGGFYIDLAVGGRLLVDFRYTFGHSNMGFNNNPDFNFGTYVERFSYRNNTMTLSIAYLFEYDVKLKNKGMSTIKDSNKKSRK